MARASRFRNSGLFLIASILAAAPWLPGGAVSTARAQTPKPCDFTVDFCSSTFRKGVLLLQYAGGGCNASDNGQSAGSVTCSGDSVGAATIRVLVTDRSDPADPTAHHWFDGTVGIGDVFTVNAANAGATLLGPTTWAFLYDGANLVQTVSFVTSCDEPLREGDRFGALRLSRPRFPQIPVWAMSDAFNDGSQANPRRCVGSLTTPDDSLIHRPRTVSVRFLRDRRAEARPTFGGYRIYRVTVTPDTTRMMLIRRFSRQADDERTWNFSVVDTTRNSPTLEFLCRTSPSSPPQVVHDSVVTFVDPDSNGNYVKVACRDEATGQLRPGCQQLGDSIFVLIPPPGPHDGFRTWYSITYEARNQTSDANYEDLFVPDTLGIIGPCGDPLDPLTCPNLNNKCYNMIAEPVEPSGGPTVNLERVGVVPNPYRARENWERPGTTELHFINLPENSTILIYTASGDLVTRLEHRDPVRDFERWDLKNEQGRDIASGIYMYRVEAHSPQKFSFQDRFIVIR